MVDLGQQKANKIEIFSETTFKQININRQVRKIHLLISEYMFGLGIICGI